MSDLEEIFLAFDTSNYTTSCAACTMAGEVVVNVKKLLPVAPGERGLRQSDALFHHTAAIPDIMSEVGPYLKGKNIVAVGASERPRDTEGSYMPCFLAGKSAAAVAQKTLGVPYFDFSHQCGHVAAALYSVGREDLYGKRFCAFHVSGGTTDILLVEPEDKRVFKVWHIGGTLDINAGQAIDRCGVMMGLPFPAGCHMEQLALAYEGKTAKIKTCVKGLSANLSGVENKAKELYDGENREETASAVIEFVTNTLEKLCENLFCEYGNIPIIFAGGVMSCSIIKERLSKYGSFAAPAFSSDNAAGVALLTRRKFLSEF